HREQLAEALGEPRGADGEGLAPGLGRLLHRVDCDHVGHAASRRVNRPLTSTMEEKAGKRRKTWSPCTAPAGRVNVADPSLPRAPAAGARTCQPPSCHTSMSAD